MRFATCWIELRGALRGLWRSPMYCGVALASLTLGLAAVTIFFTLVDRLMLRPLPLPEPERLVNLFSRTAGSDVFLQHSFPNYQDLRDRNNVLTELAACQWVSLSLTESERPERLLGQIVTANFFSVLGVPPFLGRTFTPEEDRSLNTHPVAVLSHGFWQRRFAGQPVLGHSLQLNGRAFTIVGVMPKGFRSRGPIDPTEIWLPFQMHPAVFPQSAYVDRRGWTLFHLIGRLRPGVELSTANAALRQLAEQLATEFPSENQEQTVIAVPLTESAIVEPKTTALYAQRARLAAWACGLLLLIACTNVSTLLWGRAQERRHETALRLALGAKRRQVILQALSESLLLFLFAVPVALPLAAFGRDLLLRVRPAFWTADATDFSLDLRVFALALLVALGAALFSALLPAWRALRLAPAPALLQRHDGGIASRGAAGKLLAVLQLALSLVALIAAGLFCRSFWSAQKIDPGFDADRLLTMTWNAMALGHGESEGRRLAVAVLARVQTLPGVETAELTSLQLLNPNDSRRYVTFPAGSGERTEEVLIGSAQVGPEYFATLGIELLQGRAFLPQDRVESARVAVINSAMERRYWGGASAIGQRFFLAENEPVEVVGVAAESKRRTLIEAPEPFFYLPLAQVYSPQTTLYVRTAGRPADLLPQIRAEVQAILGPLPLFNVTTLRELSTSSLAVQRTGFLVMGLLAAFAVLLAVMGVYGVTADGVRRRRRELGIRAALGASPQQLLQLVLKQAVKLIALGLLFGWILALAASRLVQSFLYGVSPTDPLTFVALAVLLAAIAGVASFVPTRRAAQGNPAAVLREG